MVICTREDFSAAASSCGQNIMIVYRLYQKIVKYIYSSNIQLRGKLKATHDFPHIAFLASSLVSMIHICMYLSEFCIDVLEGES